MKPTNTLSSIFAPVSCGTPLQDSISASQNCKVLQKAACRVMNHPRTHCKVQSPIEDTIPAQCVHGSRHCVKELTGMQRECRRNCQTGVSRRAKEAKAEAREELRSPGGLSAVCLISRTPSVDRWADIDALPVHGEVKHGLDVRYRVVDFRLQTTRLCDVVTNPAMSRLFVSLADLYYCPQRVTTALSWPQGVPGQYLLLHKKRD